MSTAAQEKELPWHLQGNWYPVQDELTVSGLEVEGEIPRELNGIYVRNGMNPRSGWSDHWFFGNGMVHGVELADGKASYRNRFVKTPYYEQDMDMLTGIMDPVASPANTHIFQHAGRILTFEEAHIPWQIDRKLGTVGPVDFGGKLNRPFTAHPRICPETGEMLAFGYAPMSEPHLVYYRIDPQGEMVQYEPIDIPRPVMMHDWNVTRNHVIFMDLPIVFSLDHGGFAFKPECGARLGVMPRSGTNADVRWFDIEPCYVFHPLNSHEEGNRLVLYVCRQPRAMVGGLDNVGSNEDTSARLWRWTIDLDAGNVKEEQVDDSPGDFPRIDDRLTGLKARYGYTLGMVPASGSPQYDRWVHKHDLDRGTRTTHDLGENLHGGEPQFVPRTPDSGEDDGFVVTIAHDESTDQSSFFILDAQNIESAPLAKVKLPRRVPYGAHGNWIADA